MKKKIITAIYYFSKLIFFLFIFLCLSLSISSQKIRTPTAAKSKSKRILYGEASFYANKFNGRKTANGEIFSQKKYTCACNVLPLGTWIKVTNIRNGKSVVVKVNDRIHPKIRRLVDLAKIAATQLGYVGHGVTRVKVEVIEKPKPI